MVVSGSSFASTLILARSLDVTQFGRFWLGYTVITLMAAIQHGFMLQPLALRGSVLDDDDFARYASVHVILQAMFVTATAVLTGLVALTWEPLRPVGPALVVGTVAYELQVFCRRALYTRSRVGSALVNDGVSYGLQAVLFGVAHLTIGLTESRALWIVALTSFLAFLVGYRQLGLRVRIPIGPVREVVHDDFQIGKWTGTVEGLAIVSTYAWPVILSAVASLRATAGFGVITQIFGPLRLFLRPFDNYYMAVTSRAVALEGTRGVNRILGRAILLFAPPYFVYLLAVGVFGPALLPVVFGEPYRDYAGAIRVFACAAALHLPATVLGAEIQARRLLHVSLIDVAAAAVLTYTVGIFLAIRWELVGVAVTQLLVALLQMGVLTVFVALARMGVTETPVSEPRPGR